MTQVSTSATKLYTFLISLIISGLMTACSQQIDTVAPANVNEEMIASARLNAAVSDSLATLKSAASFPIGSLHSSAMLKGDEKVQRIIANEFNSLTVGMFMNVQWQKGKFLYNVMDSRVLGAEKYGARLHGHCLVYHEAAPEWLTQFKGSTEEFEKEVKIHVQTIVGRYKGRVHSWDVINEIFERQNGKMKQTAFRKLYNSDEAYMEFVKKCFIWAHEADPSAKLFYNDNAYGQFEPMLPAVLKMVSEFRKSGVPIHGLGSQMHINVNTTDESIRKSLQVLASTGLLVHVSELDIAINPNRSNQLVISDKLLKSQALKFQTVANAYKQYVPTSQQHGITVWGLTDTESDQVKDNGPIEMPLLFTSKLEKKQSYFGMLSGLKN
ncbi:hypothetical protein VF12_39275 [Nostoc linckia z15]|nr:hypothetical protein VF12_39275 [Nostoc linckia z15]